LEIYLGMSPEDAEKDGWRGTDQGKKLKSIEGWDGWQNTDIWGFKALPGGDRDAGHGKTLQAGSSGYWWSSTYLWTYWMEYDHDQIARFNNIGGESNGFSVRCLKDTNTSTNQVDLQKGLVAYYPFNGNVNDESGNGHHGIIHGATLTTDRFNDPNSSYFFNGIDNYIEVPDNPDIDFGKTINFSIVFWFKLILNKDLGAYGLINKGTSNADIYGLDLILGQEAYARFNFGIENHIASLYNTDYLSVNDPCWHMMVAQAVRDKNTIQLYQDGVLIGEMTLTGIEDFIMSSDASLKIGVDRLFYYYFGGNIDDIRIYNRVLNDSEIKVLYDEGDYPGRLPSIATTNICNIKQTNVTIGGTFNSDGGSDIVLKGICWNTSPNPDTSNSKTYDGNGLCSFTSSVANLLPNTTYYARAYAINNAGVGYGNELSFVTLGDDLVDLQNGLIAYYPFNGNAKDESGNDHNGTTIGATLTADRFGNPDQAYLFNGQNNAISITDLHIPSSETTINCWVKVLNDNGIGDIISKNFGYYDIEVLIRNVNDFYQIEWYIGDKYFYLSNKNFIINPDTSTFDMLTLVYDGQHVRFYINNIIVACKNVSGQIYNNTLPLLFGAFNRVESGSRYLNGILDDIRIYNRALNNAEIDALYKENNISITTPDLSVVNKNTFEIPIKVHNILAGDNAVSCQFDFTYNQQKLQYKDCITAGTMTENGSIQINSQNDKLSIAWAGQNPLADSGTLVRLRFKALESGAVTPAISEFLVNTDTIKNITNGTITITNAYGDVDGNNAVQAYDAALALQYSVGQDPLPEIDPMPWEDWRITVANVDNEATVSAYDASLILQYTVRLIQSFPVQGHLKSTSVSQADISVEIENGNMVFRSSGDLKGLNIHIEGNAELLGVPEQSDANAILAVNYSSSELSIGLAMANTPPEDEVILTIPVNGVPDEPIILHLLVNNQEKQVNLGMLTGLTETFQKSIEIYPNPANTILYFKNLPKNVSISIFDLQGRKIKSGILTENQLDITELSFGFYTVHIEHANKTFIKKLIKH
jgi:hypothetical protein